jgi:general secretion pathway protein K
MRKRDEQGVALLLALLVLTLLVALILEFDAEARREYQEAAAFRDNVKATTLVRAGVQAARAALQLDVQKQKPSGETFDALTDVWATPLTNYPVGDGLLTAQIEDEAGKLNLNDLAPVGGDPNAKQAPVTRLKRLFEQLQLNPELVDAIVDWMDPDDTPEPSGAETGYYQTLRPAYRAANGPLETLADLRLVKGMTDDIVRKLSKYVTVVPLAGGSKVNINTADPIVLQALDPGITQAMAAEIVAGRPYKTPQDTERIASFEPIARVLRGTNVYDVKSTYFAVHMTITVNDVTKIAEAVLRRDETKGESSLEYLRIL